MCTYVVEALAGIYTWGEIVVQIISFETLLSKCWLDETKPKDLEKVSLILSSYKVAALINWHCAYHAYCSTSLFHY